MSVDAPTVATAAADGAFPPGAPAARPAVASPVAEGSAPADAYLAFDVFAGWGVRALVTTRAAGTFSTAGDEPAHAVLDRWAALHEHLAPGPSGRLASARQVHGAEVIDHVPGWRGWLRGPAADGHLSVARGTAMVVSVADCVPVFLAHPSGAAALLHAGWRGTAAGIVGVAVRLLAAAGFRAVELRALLGPAICGRCYEVSPDVHARLTGRTVAAPTPVDLHAVLAAQLGALGVRDVWRSDLCTRCGERRLFSHRGGDAGRQLAALVADG